MRDWSASIRPARQSDGTALHRNCFPEDPLGTVQDYLRWYLAHQNTHRMLRLVAEVDGMAVANGQLDLHLAAPEIGSLVVAPAYRRRGIATAMIQALLQAAEDGQASTVQIMVAAEDRWIGDWYRRLGFVDREVKLWPPGERMIVLDMQI